jgi:hypothetical protein
MQSVSVVCPTECLVVDFLVAQLRHSREGKGNKGAEGLNSRRGADVERELEEYI